MKIKLIMLLALSFLWVTSCSARSKSEAETRKTSPEWMCPDSIAYSHLGKNLSNLLFSPKTVKCYSITWEDTVTQAQLEPYFRQDSLLQKLSKEEIAIIQFALLSDGDNYTRDSIVVMSPYRPCLDIEFCNKKEKAHLLVSLSDFTWTILYDDKKQFNFHYHSRSFERLCKKYLNKASK